MTRWRLGVEHGVDWAKAMRSINAADYQDVPRPIAVMAKAFAAGSATGRHHHVRAQFLYASDGLMTATTVDGAWVVPPGHALLIPAALEHAVEMHGPVQMRTAYLDPDVLAADASRCRVLRVSTLLDRLLSALAEEPVLYDEAGRGGHLAALALNEIARAPDAPFTATMPQDLRLRRICDALIDDPADTRGLDHWSDSAAMSRRTLTRRFRKETGLSFGAWRERIRLLAAMARLAQGEPPAKVAGAVGYGEARALKAMMRRVAGERIR